MIVELPSTRAEGLDMPDGSKYNANGTGRVTVERPDHVQAVRQSGLRIRGQQFAFQKADSVTCTSCAFEQLALFSSRPCPKCGGSFQEVQSA